MVIYTSGKLSNEIQLTPHQAKIVERASHIFERRNLVYISAEERVGKTYAALELVRLNNKSKNVLIVTKKKALDGWLKSVKLYFNASPTSKDNTAFELVNFEALHKLSIKQYDLIIVDEAHHALSAYPKPSKTAKLLQSIAYHTPVIFLSATPCAQSYSQLFHQLNISKFSPWDNYRNFYEWFRWYGIPQIVHVSSGQIVKYDKLRNGVVDEIFENYFVSYSRAEANFTYEPKDVVHYIELPSELLSIMNNIKRKKVLALESNILMQTPEITIPIDNISKEIKTLHQLEGSTIKLSEKMSLNLDYTAKIDKIKELFGDTDKLAIFYEYKQEKILLEQHFKHALILQGSTYAEGVDLSHLDYLVVYSMNFSSAKYSQRRARQCNINRTTPIEVHYLLCKDCISEAVYDCVVNKHKNFTASLYAKEYKQKGDG